MYSNKILLLISLALFTHSKILVMDMEDLRKLSADGNLRNLISDTPDRSLIEPIPFFSRGTCWARNGKIYKGNIDVANSRFIVVKKGEKITSIHDSGVWVYCIKYKLD